MTALGAVDELDQGDGLDDELDRHHGRLRLVVEGRRRPRLVIEGAAPAAARRRRAILSAPGDGLRSDSKMWR